MKIITLNIWGAKIYDDFVAFIKEHRDTDIFCFQEVYKDAEPMLAGTEYAYAHMDIFYELEKLLPDHAGFFHPAFKGIYGLAMFVKKGVSIDEMGEIYVHKDKEFFPDGEWGHHARNLQYLKTTWAGQALTVINLHGLWNGQGKSDTEDRLAQSQRIVDFIRGVTGKIVMCGDFNLRMDTKSLAMIEQAGLRNLIREYQVPSTRTPLYEKPEKHADYIFVSPEIKEKHFSVMSHVVSDHSPLLLEI